MLRSEQNSMNRFEVKLVPLSGTKISGLGFSESQRRENAAMMSSVVSVLISEMGHLQRGSATLNLVAASTKITNLILHLWALLVHSPTSATTCCQASGRGRVERGGTRLEPRPPGLTASHSGHLYLKAASTIH